MICWRLMQHCIRNREECKRSLHESSFCAGRSSFMWNALWQIRGSVECGKHFAGLIPVAWDIEIQEEKLRLLLSRQAVGLTKGRGSPTRASVSKLRENVRFCSKQQKLATWSICPFLINKLTASILILSQNLKEALLDLSYLVSACRNSSSHPRENDAAHSWCASTWRSWQTLASKKQGWIPISRFKRGVPYHTRTISRLHIL